MLALSVPLVVRCSQPNSFRFAGGLEGVLSSASGDKMGCKWDSWTFVTKNEVSRGS